MMRKLILAAGVAALAISMPATAKPDRDNGGRGAKAAKVERGGGKARAAQRVERRGKAEVRVAARQERGGERRQKAREQRVERAQKARSQRAERVEKAREQRVERRQERREARAERRDDRRERVAVNRNRDHDVVRVKDGDRRFVRVDRDGDRNVIRVRDRDDDRRFARIFGDRGVRGFASDCPPGLVQLARGCMPYGQAKKLDSVRLPAAYASNVLPLRLRNIYRDNDRYTYRWGDGYLYRVNRESQLVSALLPLIGAGLGVGTQFPYSGANYMMPSYYQPFYPQRNDDYYRYANGYLYEIDRDTGLIEDMIPLLDRGYGMGQMLPASYGAYNVPYQYRSLYQDTPNAYYRYAPGAIYQVDPTSQLITAVASLLAPGMTVGQQLPPAYSAYNVPLGYRDMYYDRPDAWYRYNNGHIYQVDPTTQLITAIVRAIV